MLKNSARYCWGCIWWRQRQTTQHTPHPLPLFPRPPIQGKGREWEKEGVDLRLPECAPTLITCPLPEDWQESEVALCLEAHTGLRTGTAGRGSAL